MKLTPELAHEFFRGYYIERWNEMVRIMPMYEIDKHGHKLIIAFCIAKYEEMQGHTVDWEYIIKNSIFELLRRIVISDIKSPIYQEIKKHKDVFENLNKYVYKKLKNKIGDEKLQNEFLDFLTNENKNDDINNHIIDAAHIYSSYWEFQIMKSINLFSHQNTKTDLELIGKIKKYSYLDGVSKLLNQHSIKNFIDICGQLRFQIRWAQTPRLPRTSVLGHVTLVAIFTYLICRDLDCCKKRIYNNFFGAIFHDLPEAVTRDIVSPIKKSSIEFDELISKIERELAEEEIFPHLEKEWINEIKYFTQNEFTNKIIRNGNIETGFSVDDITQHYNRDEFLPFDGEIIRFADHFSAYLEAMNSINSGIRSEDLILATQSIKETYAKKTISNLPVFSLFTTT